MDSRRVTALDSTDLDAVHPKMVAGNSFLKVQQTSNYSNNVVRSQNGLSLVELQESAQNQELMSDSMTEKAKHNFMRLAADFKSDKLRSESLATVR